jgi:hypothetical protein
MLPGLLLEGLIGRSVSLALLLLASTNCGETEMSVCAYVVAELAVSAPIAEFSGLYNISFDSASLTMHTSFHALFDLQFPFYVIRDDDGKSQSR